MRPWVLLLILLVAVAGCLGGGEDAMDEGPDDEGEGDETSPSEGDPMGVDAPVLDVGQAWTYEATGVYNTGEEITVTVAEASSNGYLLAGETKEDLFEDIVWGRVWHGPMSEALNPLDPDGAERLVLFDFPLWDGKTWTDGDREVTVQAGMIPAPGGEVEGFELERLYEDGSMRWTYSEEVGYMTSFISITAGTTFQELTLVRQGTADAWAWYERVGERVDTGGYEPSMETQSVPEQADDVILSAGGWGESTVVVQPTVASGMGPSVYQADEEESWRYHGLPSSPGDWTFSTQGHEDAPAWVSGQPVAWVTP